MQNFKIEVGVHTLTKTEMQALAELRPFELNEQATIYCGERARICNMVLNQCVLNEELPYQASTANLCLKWILN